MLRPCFPRITNGGEKPAIRISDIAPSALVGDIMFVNGAMVWRASLIWRWRQDIAADSWGNGMQSPTHTRCRRRPGLADGRRRHQDTEVDRVEVLRTPEEEHIRYGIPALFAGILPAHLFAIVVGNAGIRLNVAHNGPVQQSCDLVGVTTILNGLPYQNCRDEKDRHWPYQDVEAEARQTNAFIIPTGNPHRPQSEGDDGHNNPDHDDRAHA